MKLIPYYKRTITSHLTNDSVLNKFDNIINENRTNNFPEYEGFIGGEIKNGQFKLTRTGKWRAWAFPVIATGQPDSNGNWTLTFESNKLYLIWFLVTMSAMTFVTFKYETAFFTPIMIIYYVSEQISFSRDSWTLEKIILNELGTI